MREAGKSGAKPAPRTPPSTAPAQARNGATPQPAHEFSVRAPAAESERQARAAADAVARGGTATWSGGGPAQVGPGPHLDVDLTPAREQAPYGVIIEDGLPLGEGQIHRSDFVEQMAAEIYRLADEELASVNRRAADCPFLAHWHAYYRTKSAALIDARSGCSPSRSVRISKACGGAARSRAEGCEVLDLLACLRRFGEPDAAGHGGSFFGRRR